VAPVENAGKLRVKAILTCVVVPDRFGNDIIADPEAPGGAGTPLPWAPMVTGFLANSPAMLALVTPGPGQRAELRKDQGTAFTGADVALEKRAVSAGVVAAGPAWHLERFAADGQADPLRFKWRMPFPALWRLAALGDTRCSSAFFTDKESPYFDKKDAILPRGKDFGVRLGMIYLYDRTAGTPPEAVTPADLMRDALGPLSARQALDEEGLTGYRRASGPTTWADITVTLEALAYLFERKLEVQDAAHASHLCDDLPLFIEGLDQRLKEYAGFARMVQGPAATHLTTLTEFGQKAAALPGSADIPALSAAIKQLTAKESGDNKKKFEECRRAILAVSGPREELLKAYRQRVVALRDSGDDRLRALCQEVLRNRFYIEADWRGEPIDAPAYWLGPRPYE
jgi:hypothetical protein